eukprot:IDg7188t1
MSSETCVNNILRSAERSRPEPYRPSFSVCLGLKQGKSFLAVTFVGIKRILEPILWNCEYVRF